MTTTKSTALPPATEAEKYQTLVRSLRRRQGFGIVFVQCSPARASQLLKDLRRDLPQKQIATLSLDQPINKLYPLVEDLPQRQATNILVIQGLEKSFEAYIKPGYGGEGDYYQLDTVPPVLNHLNQQRENFRDHFPTICFVFVLPHFGIKYMIHRAPDFFDWRAGVYEFQDPQDTRDLRALSEEQPLHERIFQRLPTAQQIVSFLNTPIRFDGLTRSLRAFIPELQADVLSDWKQYHRAIASYDRAVAINPDYHAAWYNRGISLDNLGRYEEAIASYDRAVAIKPDKHEAWTNRGNSLHNLGRYEEAIASYDRAVAINPDKHEAWNNRGLSLDNLGRYEEAIASYDRAVAIKPDYHAAWNNRGLSLDNLGRYEEAIASYDRAVAIKPDDDAAWNNRGISLDNLGRKLQEQGQHEEALAKLSEGLASYDRAVAIKPDLHEAWYNKACCYALQGQLEPALDQLRHAIHLNPDQSRQMAQTDSDFDAIRNEPRFQALLATDGERM